MTAYFKHPARSRTARGGISETGIEEARVMDAEFANHRQIGSHFSSIIRRDCHRLAADKNVECAGIKDDLPVAGVDLFPIFGRVIESDVIQINHACMGFGAVADQRCVGQFQVYGEPQTFINHRRAINQRGDLMQGAQGFVIQRRIPPAKPDLVQPHAGTHQHRK